MPKFDKYLFREFFQATFAVLIVLMIVSLGGVFAVVLGDIARGKVPAGLMLSQLGLQVLGYLPVILPLGLMLGMLLSVSRLYRDAEMPVFTAAGVGPKRFLRPVLMMVIPTVIFIALCSLWFGPWARQYSQKMIDAGNRNLLVSGLEPGRFAELTGRGGVIYIGGMSDDGTLLSRVFVYTQKEDRIDITTSKSGKLRIDGDQRFITLDQGFRVEGPIGNQLDYRLMRYASNDIRLPDAKTELDANDPEMLSTPALLKDDRREAKAQFYYRLAPPILALAFGLLAVPLARSPPRQARYGRMIMGFLAYLVAMNLSILGAGWIAEGKTPVALGLWWLLLPLLLLALWSYMRDGSMKGSRLSKRYHAPKGGRA